MDKFKCVLVTGGCGAIGSEVVNYLKLRYPGTQFVVLDALTYAGCKTNIEPPYDNYVFVHGDICDSNIIIDTLTTYNPNVIIHLAAESHVDESFSNSLKFTHTNVVGTHTLLECARLYGKIEKFIHMSTDEVYGSIDDNIFRKETHILNPSNPYSSSKAAAEMLCNAYILSYKFPIIIVRCCNAISKYQHDEKLIPKCVKQILSGEKIPIHGDGSSKRTYIHSLDIARAIDTIAASGQLYNIYNVGTSYEYTVLDVVQRILKMMRPEETIDNWIYYTPNRLFQDRRYAIDTTEISYLNWVPTISFEDALKEVVQHHTKLMNRTL